MPPMPAKTAAATPSKGTNSATKATPTKTPPKSNITTPAAAPTKAAASATASDGTSPQPSTKPPVATATNAAPPTKTPPRASATTPAETPAKASTSAPAASATASAPQSSAKPPAETPTKAAASGTAAAPAKPPPKEVPTLTRIKDFNKNLNSTLKKKKGAAQKESSEEDPEAVDPNPEGSIQTTKAESETGDPQAGGTGYSGTRGTASNAEDSTPNFGDGLLNLAQGYEFEEEKIYGFLHDVSVKRTEADVKNVAEGILMFILTENNEMKQKLEQEEVNWKDEKGEEEARAAVEEIRKLSEAQLRGNKRLADTPSIPIPASILRQQGVPMKKTTGRDKGVEVARLLKFDEVDLPMITIYDYLGWLLSKLGSSESGSAQRTAKGYYLPLLALYSRWCTIISGLVGFDSLPMVHIAWWGKNVLLGATLGDVPEGESRYEFYKQPRLTMLTTPETLAYVPPKGGFNDRFGACAETQFFIYAKRKSLKGVFVQGFAMVPPQKEDLPKNKAIASGALSGDAKRFDAALAYQQKYQEATLRLRDPCKESCQLLFEQVDVDWKKAFNVREFWQGKLGTDPTSAPPRAETVDDVGEGPQGRAPPDMTGTQILGNTLSTLGQHFGQHLATATMHGVLQKK